MMKFVSSTECTLKVDLSPETRLPQRTAIPSISGEKKAKKCFGLWWNQQILRIRQSWRCDPHYKLILQAMLTRYLAVYPVARHILELDIDSRLAAGRVDLVDDIQTVMVGGKEMHFYSFASKYCSHHNEKDYPIYDSYVDEVLRYFRARDGFARFQNAELKIYSRFKELLLAFRAFYGLERFSLKEVDKYIWQLGKEYFPKTYA